MEFGCNQSRNNLLLDNIEENIPITNNASTHVINHQNFKENINPVFEIYDEGALNHLKKSMTK